MNNHRKLLCILLLAMAYHRSSGASICDVEFKTFLHHLNSQCPSSIPPFFSSSPIQVDGGESFERAMSHSLKNDEYTTALLFYAAWCPFSKLFHSKFSTLSSMYPQIKHIMVQQSSAMPSTFSQYGIHSVPSLLIVSQTTQLRYYGPKDLQSLVNFYRRTTGLNPVVDMVEDANVKTDQKMLHLCNGASLKEVLLREPYLLLSVLFVLSRAFLYFFPEIVSRLVALWVAYIPRLNLGIFGESRQLIGRVLNLIDIKRVWSKLEIRKTRNFHTRARNARVWASSLAFVSLGGASSSRIFPSRGL